MGCCVDGGEGGGADQREEVFSALHEKRRKADRMKICGTNILLGCLHWFVLLPDKSPRERTRMLFHISCGSDL